MDRALLPEGLAPLSEPVEPPEPDEPGALALARAPEGGVVRVRFSEGRPWLDWRADHYFIEGADEAVWVEWIDALGRRGHYLQGFLEAAQASTPQTLPDASPQEDPQAPQRYALTHSPKAWGTLKGAAPPEPVGCAQWHPGLWALFGLFALRRRR